MKEAAAAIERLIKEAATAARELERRLQRWNLAVRLPASKGRLLVWPCPSVAGRAVSERSDLLAVQWDGEEGLLHESYVQTRLCPYPEVQAIIDKARTPSGVLDVIRTLERMRAWLQARIEGLERHERACVEHDPHKAELEARLTLEGLK